MLHTECIMHMCGSDRPLLAQGVTRRTCSCSTHATLSQGATAVTHTVLPLLTCMQPRQQPIQTANYTAPLPPPRRPRPLSLLCTCAQGYDRVKAVGVGHSWWKEQFCAGNATNAINIVTTEL